jgi:hypothetical protein
MITTSTRRLLLAAGATLALACGGGDAATGPTATVTGTYSLESYNGKPLPFTMTDTVDGQVFTSTLMAPFSITLNADKSVRLISTFRVVAAGTTQILSDTGKGTWSISGNAVTVTTTDGDHTSATWNGSDMLTISDPPVVAIFRK